MGKLKKNKNQKLKVKKEEMDGGGFIERERNFIFSFLCFSLRSMKIGS